MTRWLIRQFVAGGAGTDERVRRLRCGRLSGAVGIAANVALGLMKAFAAGTTGSVAVMADAVNNLSDAGASVLTLLGFSLAGKKSDAGHPFGHARYEYMTGVVVSALVIVVGVKFILTAWDKVVHPTPIVSDALVIALLGVFVLVKLWLWRFNLGLSKLIGSASLKATGFDSRNDAIATVAALFAILLHRLMGVNIDGYIGLAVGGFIIYSGLNMVKETAGPLLGQSPDPRMVREIAALVLAHEGVLGIHDLIVHDYGPGHVFATVHVEIDSREDIFWSHGLVDDIEREALERLHVQLVGHMDPIDTQNPKLKEVERALSETLLPLEGVLAFHDLRIVTGSHYAKVIFDVVVTHEKSARVFERVREVTRDTLAAIDPSYIPVIQCDLDYCAREQRGDAVTTISAD